MTRLSLVFGIGVTFILAACGNGANAANGATSPSPGGPQRGGASGQLVQIDGVTLILTGANGDTTVTFTNSTTMTSTCAATIADIAQAERIVASGTSGWSGVTTATAVRL